MKDIIINFRNIVVAHYGFGSVWLADTLLILGLALMAIGSYYIAKILLWALEVLVEKTPTKWDDDLITKRLTNAIAQLAPALTVNWGLPLLFFNPTASTVHWIDTLTSFYIIWAGVRVLVIFTGNLYGAMRVRPNTQPYAVKGIFQMIKLVLISGGIIIALSLMLGQTPAAILTALGASAAVIMLVFRDTILGLVASVQLTANKMLHRGDWITCEKHDINGEVLDISLTTVKIRNWDNSVTTVPPYMLVSESFRNFQPMRSSGARRVERSVYIDVNTVRKLSGSEIDTLCKKGLLNSTDGLSGAEDNVNLRLFRQYMEFWLSHQKEVESDSLCMVRQMPPTPSGLPVQFYFFTSTVEWKEYEKIQSDIFDHIYATVGEFGLRIFQTPAGTDISNLSPAHIAQQINSSSVKP